MGQKTKELVMSDGTAEFRRLFWESRREIVDNEGQQHGNYPIYDAAVTFAKRQKWQWAEGLLEANKISDSDGVRALELVERWSRSTPEAWQHLVHFTRSAIA